VWFEMGGTEVAAHCSAPGGAGANPDPTLKPHRRRPDAPPSGCRTARLMLCALGLAALPRGGDSGQAGRDSALVLAPGISLDRQAMRYGESRSFRLSQLAPSAMYEVKVSYPASVSFSHNPRSSFGACFFLAFTRYIPVSVLTCRFACVSCHDGTLALGGPGTLACAAQQLSAGHPQMPATINLELLLHGQSGVGRRLLNTEKLMFATPDDAAAFCAEAAVRACRPHC